MEEILLLLGHFDRRNENGTDGRDDIQGEDYPLEEILRVGQRGRSHLPIIRAAEGLSGD